MTKINGHILITKINGGVSIKMVVSLLIHMYCARIECNFLFVSLGMKRSFDTSRRVRVMTDKSSCITSDAVSNGM